MPIKVSLDAQEPTFGAFYDFVDMARGAGMNREEEVPKVLIDNVSEEWAVDRYEFEIDAMVRPSVTIEPDMAQNFLRMVNSILDKDLDARGWKDGLEDLRDHLSGLPRNDQDA